MDNVQFNASEQIISALIPTKVEQSNDCLPEPLEVADLYTSSRDTSISYSLVRVDKSGRINSGAVLDALHWTTGDKVDLSVVGEFLLLRRSPGGLYPIPIGNRFTIPARGRHACRIYTGMQLLVAMFSEHDLLLACPLSTLQNMILGYFRAETYKEGGT